jgi:hypothetical protein
MGEQATGAVEQSRALLHCRFLNTGLCLCRIDKQVGPSSLPNSAIAMGWVLGAMLSVLGSVASNLGVNIQV